MRHAFLPAALGLACAPCSGYPRLATTSPSGAVLATNQAAYVAVRDRAAPWYRFTLIATYANRTKAPVYLGRCDPDSPHPIYTVRLVGAGPVGGPAPWRAGYDPIWACGGHDRPILVRPGEARVDTLRLSGPHVWDSVLEGRFQLTYHTRSCPDADRCPVRYDLRSNVFEVRLARSTGEQDALPPPTVIVDSQCDAPARPVPHAVRDWLTAHFARLRARLDLPCDLVNVDVRGPSRSG